MQDSDKLDHIVEKVASIDVTLKFQAKQLEEHIKRTQMLETRIIPIEDHVKFIQRIARILAWALAIPGTFSVILKLIGKI
jgi:hypothetical protein